MQKPKPPRVFGIIVLTTITAVFWVFYGLYLVLTKPTPPNVPKKILDPLNPEINLALLNAIANKDFYEKGKTLPLTSKNSLHFQQDN